MKNLRKILLSCVFVIPTICLVGNTDADDSNNTTTVKNSISTTDENNNTIKNSNKLKNIFDKHVEKGSVQQSQTAQTETINDNNKTDSHGLMADLIKKFKNSNVNDKTTDKLGQNLPNNGLPLNRQDGFANIIGAVSPAVVSIVIIQEIEDRLPNVFEDFFNGSPFDFFGFDDFFGEKQKKKPRRSQKSIGAASGFCVKIENDKLYIATNYHVVEDAKTVAIFFNDQSVDNVLHDKDQLITAKIHGVDPKSDLAVLEVDMNNKNLKGRDVQTIKWGSSENLKIGNYVIAIGNPFGIGISVSQGIVSAKGRHLMGGTRNNSMEDYIQHTAALNRGNSGGVLIDMNSEVVGVNNAIYSPNGGNVGVGFAIPSDNAKTIIDSLIQYKRTFRGWLGATIQSIKTKEAINMGLLPAATGKLEDLPPYFGVLVNEVSTDGPAAQAGIMAGDIIVLFDGQIIDEANKLPRLVNNHKIKEPATLTVVRRDSATGELKQIEIKVDIGDYQDFEKLNKKSEDNSESDNFSDKQKPIKISGLDIFVNDEDVLIPGSSDKKQKAVVKKVKRQRDGNNELFGSLFEFANPFEIGDIIEVANSTQITSAKQLKEIVDAFQKEHPGESMTFKISRRSGKRLSPVIITITINKADPNAKPDDDQYESSDPRKAFHQYDDDDDEDTSRGTVRRYRFFNK